MPSTVPTNIDNKKITDDNKYWINISIIILCIIVCVIPVFSFFYYVYPSIQIEPENYDHIHIREKIMEKNNNLWHLKYRKNIKVDVINEDDNCSTTSSQQTVESSNASISNASISNTSISNESISNASISSASISSANININCENDLIEHSEYYESYHPFSSQVCEPKYDEDILMPTETSIIPFNNNK